MYTKNKTYILQKFNEQSKYISLGHSVREQLIDELLHTNEINYITGKLIEENKYPGINYIEIHRKALNNTTVSNASYLLKTQAPGRYILTSEEDRNNLQATLSSLFYSNTIYERLRNVLQGDADFKTFQINLTPTGRYKNLHTLAEDLTKRVPEYFEIKKDESTYLSSVFGTNITVLYSQPLKYLNILIGKLGNDTEERRIFDIIKITLAILPIILGIDNTLTENQTQLLNKIAKIDEEDTSEELLKELGFKEGDLEKIVVNNLIKLLDKDRARQEQKLTVEISNLNEIIHNYERDLTEYYKRLQEKQNTLFGLQYNIEKNLDNLANDLSYYLENSKTIKEFYIPTNQSVLNVRIIAPVKYFDKEPLEVMMNNEKWLGDFTDEERGDIKQVLTEIFINNRYELITQTTASLNIADYDISLNGPAIGFDINQKDPETGLKPLPHPHLMEFKCLGNNNALIIKALKNRDIITALEQVNAAAYNFNFTDGVVFNRFIHIITDRCKNSKCFKELTTGTYKSYDEIIKDLHALYIEEVTETITIEEGGE